MLTKEERERTQLGYLIASNDIYIDILNAYHGHDTWDSFIKWLSERFFTWDIDFENLATDLGFYKW